MVPQCPNAGVRILGSEFGILNQSSIHGAYHSRMPSTTTIIRAGTPVNKIVPADGAVRFEDGAGTVLAVVRPYVGTKSDNAWVTRY